MSQEAHRGEGSDWIEKHPWIRKNNEESLHFVQMPEGMDEKGMISSILGTELYKTQPNKTSRYFLQVYDDNTLKQCVTVS